jgi:hypothetical protein
MMWTLPPASAWGPHFSSLRSILNPDQLGANAMLYKGVRAPIIFDVGARAEQQTKHGLYNALEAALAATAECHHPSVLAHFYIL